ncbi:MAG: FTR1 family protein [Deltaproteobacteria bacterium]|nr:FTR1 family protein [Deltaproteobacteria bacterium]
MGTKAFLSLISLLILSWASAADDVQERVQRTAFILNVTIQEYKEGVEAGEIVNSIEYEEALSFFNEAGKQFESLKNTVSLDPAVQSDLDQRLQLLSQWIQERADEGMLASFSAQWGEDLAKAFKVGLNLLPKGKPSISSGAKLYQEKCSLCHGSMGGGDGPAAAGLEPKPAHFNDPERMGNRSPQDLFQIITVGIKGTSMVAWENQLSEVERWDLASILHLFLGSPDILARGEKVHPSLKDQLPSSFQDWQQLLQWSDDEFVIQFNEQIPNHSYTTEDLRALALYLRSQTLSGEGFLKESSGVDGVESTLTTVRQTLGAALDRYRQRDIDEAKSLALDAYLHFEAVESKLRVKDPELASELEMKFSEIQIGISDRRPWDEIDEKGDEIFHGLNATQQILSEKSSPSILFVQSLSIIVREGFEAMLIIAALIAFLLRLQHKDKLRFVYWGTGIGVLASFLTAWLLQGLFTISPANQEVLEGMTMLVAVAVLFYVSHWILAKAEVEKWQEFIQKRTQSALKTGSGIALGFVAFLAVYREGFETVLFYNALFGFAENGTFPVVSGFGVGLLVLLALFLLFYRFQVKIPLREFFLVTSFILYFLAFVFMGRGLHELQEAGWLAARGIPGVPAIPFLGLYPTFETVLGQSLLLFALLLGVLYVFVIQPGGERKKLLQQTRHIEKDMMTLHAMQEEISRRVEQYQKIAAVPPDILKELQDLDTKIHELMDHASHLESELLDYFEELGAKTWGAIHRK